MIKTMNTSLKTGGHYKAPGHPVEDKSNKTHLSYAYRLAQIIRKDSKGLRHELFPVKFTLMSADISRTVLFSKEEKQTPLNIHSASCDEKHYKSYLILRDSFKTFHDYFLEDITQKVQDYYIG